MPRPISATIHLEAFRHNIKRLRQSNPQSNLWAVVKANAYGHGIERVYEGIQGADGIALLDLDEAVRVRQLGWRDPILLLEGVFEARDLELCSRHNLWHTVHCDEQIDMLAAHKTHIGHRVFLKMNSGMNRLGFAPQSYKAAWTRLNALPQVEEISLMTHFSDSDHVEGIIKPMEIFSTFTRDLPGEKTVCNSAATLLHLPHQEQSSQLDLNASSDWIRPGIAMYGASPDYPNHSAQDWGLEPTMTLSAKIIGIQNLKAGDSVGYGSSFTADKTMRIGIVACGYADGYPRICPTGTPVLVDGQKSQTIGRVSMDMLCVDLTDLSSSNIGSVVTLWGKAQNGAIISIDEVAAKAHTLGYELMCSVTQRVPFVIDDQVV
jgi:alanine racemase